MTTTKAPWTGPWIARFRDGPHRDTQRVWAVGPIWQQIVIAPLPHRKSWFIARGDGIPPFPGDEPEPWPGEVEYKLASTRVARESGESVMIATYKTV